MTLPEKIYQTLQKVHDQESFIQELLVEALGWDIASDRKDFEPITYGWTEEELRAEGLSERITDGTVLQVQPIGNNPWGIFILDFKNPEAFVSGRGMTGILRSVLRGLVASKRKASHLPSFKRENLLFICTYGFRHFHFAYFKDPIQAGHLPPLAAFGWMEGDTHIRTLCTHNLPALNWLYDQTPEEWIEAWAEAFKVEKVTKKFYVEYEYEFKLAEKLIKAQAVFQNDEDVRMYTQTLFNRLLFLRFIERKGWLEFQGQKDYLRSLFSAGCISGRSLYMSRIWSLFFEGLAIEGKQVSDAIGKVKFLNGGLFEENEHDKMVKDLPNKLFKPIIGPEGLFYRYNFTVEESTPLDIEVAVDPEMLGKVFEKLVTKRRDKGSYYTPRTIVSFMCREALKNYLGGYETLVDTKDASEIKIEKARELLGKINRINVCDPACGSGAYLIGIMHELHAIARALDTRIEPVSARDDYQRKLEIINNNLYGVDNDLFATNIAQLRLWLSLAVEFQGDDPLPLPNLDFKIETEDSLTAPNPTELKVQLDLTFQPKVEEFARLKTEYAAQNDPAKKESLKININQLREYLKNGLHRGTPVKGFDWQVEFAEVFFSSDSKDKKIGGFDVVLANPPYGLKVDDSTRKQFFPVNNANDEPQSKDSYGLFMARAIQLLRDGGFFTYIVSDTWRTIRSHRPLRMRLLQETTVQHFIDLPPWVFDATVNTCVLSAIRQPAAPENKLIAGDLHNLPKERWDLLDANLNAIAAHGPDVQTIAYARYTYPQALISTYENLSFFIGSPRLYLLMSNYQFTKLGKIADVKVGLQTGDNKYYLRKRENVRGSLRVLDESKLLSEEEICNLSDDEKKNGVDPGKYAGRHFLPYDKGGESEAHEGWLPNYHVPTEYFIDWSINSVEKMKISPSARFQNSQFYFQIGLTSSRVGAYSPTFRIASNGPFDSGCSNIYCSEMSPIALCGISTSMIQRYIFILYLNHSVNSQVEDLKDMPIIKNIADAFVNKLLDHVKQIIEQQRTNPLYQYFLHEQKELDRLIYQIYGLSADDIREVELWYCRRYPKLAEAQGMLAEVQEKYASHLLHCEHIKSMPPGYWKSHPILQLIAQGESQTLEFKETLQYNPKTNQKDGELVKAALKTIAAFLNTDGGSLLLGVSDSGEIKGLDRDLPFCRHNNLDGFELKLRDLLGSSRFDPNPLGKVNITYEDLEEGTICRVDVKPLPKTDIQHLDNEVYVREGNQTRKLEGPTLTRWVTERTRT